MVEHYAFSVPCRVTLPWWARRYTVSYDGCTYILSVYSF